MGKLGAAAAVCAMALMGASLLGATQRPGGLLRPPGALSPEGFAARCVRCGRCIEACPHRAIHAAPLSAGADASTPCIEPRQQACALCADFPCAAACPTGALVGPRSMREVRMGTAVVNEERCLSYRAMRCEVCYRACPLIDEAISIDYRQREGDAIHAVFTPVVHEDACAGCGLCVQRCPVDDPGPAISVAPAEG
ncbi:4Fe-4S dicluster domain-containing protein [Parvibacter caecicola]|uniref:4Fe-4S dicluster domain-containing protein n=1 Tax=Parvibacter caecicola TaxID=747645 RepID=UPI00249CB8CA|nr:4Fe-4S dicluster domain-containing protein [Parvibacter caecicola]